MTFTDRYHEVVLQQARAEANAGLHFMDEAESDPDNGDRWLQLAQAKLYAAVQTLKTIGVQLPPLREKPTRSRRD